MERRPFHTLDGLRGVAALAIVARHSPDQSIGHVFPGSYLAVDLFFALSGFVLAHNYIHRFERGLSLSRFMQLRVIRLYPLYVLGSAIGALAICLGANGAGPSPFRWVSSILAALLFVPVAGPFAVDERWMFPFDDPSWSLFFELIANALLGLVALRLTTRSLILSCLLFALPLIAADLWFGSLDLGWQAPGFCGGLARVLFSFFAGILINRLHADGRLRVRLDPSIPLAATMVIFAVPAVGSARIAFDAVAAILLLPLIVTCSLDNDRDHELSRVFKILGVASYGIYVLHRPLYALLDLAFPGRVTDFGKTATIAVMAAAFGLALWLDRSFDRPLRRWMASRLALERHDSGGVRPCPPADLGTLPRADTAPLAR